MVGSEFSNANEERGLTEIVSVNFPNLFTNQNMAKIKPENFLSYISGKNYFNEDISLKSPIIIKAKSDNIPIKTNFPSIQSVSSYCDMDLEKRMEEIEGIITNLKTENIVKEKENKMNKFGLNVKFGKVSSNEIKMSMYGPAFHSQDGWFAFDGENYIDVENFLFDGENYCYMMPVTEAALELNDYIYHVDGWCRIVQVDEIGRLEVERIKDRTIVKIAPSKNVFGFNFYTKLVSMFDGGGDMFGMGEDNPFGNMLPFMLMSEGNSNKDILFAMMCMNNKSLGDNSMMPLLMMSMMGKDNGGDQDFATMMMMSQMMGHKKSVKKEN